MRWCLRDGTGPEPPEPRDPAGRERSGLRPRHPPHPGPRVLLATGLGSWPCSSGEHGWHPGTSVNSAQRRPLSLIPTPPAGTLLLPVQATWLSARCWPFPCFLSHPPTFPQPTLLGMKPGHGRPMRLLGVLLWPGAGRFQLASEKGAGWARSNRDAADQNGPREYEREACRGGPGLRGACSLPSAQHFPWQQHRGN